MRRGEVDGPEDEGRGGRLRRVRAQGDDGECSSASISCGWHRLSDTIGFYVWPVFAWLNMFWSCTHLGIANPGFRYRVGVTGVRYFGVCFFIAAYAQCPAFVTNLQSSHFDASEIPMFAKPWFPIPRTRMQSCCGRLAVERSRRARTPALLGSCDRVLRQDPGSWGFLTPGGIPARDPEEAAEPPPPEVFCLGGSRRGR